MDLRAARLVKQGGEKKDNTAHPPPAAVAERKLGREKGGQSYSVRVRYDTIRYTTKHDSFLARRAGFYLSFLGGFHPGGASGL
jgi:hypothetical protein